MSMIQFGMNQEKVITRKEFPLARARKTLHKEKIAILGYGVQGPAQALNLKDNGFSVIVGQRKGTHSWKKACQDGWKENVDLFDLEQACEKATILCYLLSDAAQMQLWPTVKKYLFSGKTLYFSHGFSIAYNNQTHVIPPAEVDVILVAPKGSGRSVRQLFLEGRGINSSYAVYQDASGIAEERALALGIGIGSGYLFNTTFEHEVFSDLVGERGVLMGALAGIIAAQYEVLRKHGHSPSEAFNETVEELTQSIVPLVAERGMDWMYENCSSTAQRGALDWLPRFKESVMPIFESLYNSVASGKEAEVVIKANSLPDYKAHLTLELKKMKEEELWKVGEKVRQLRP